MVFVKKCFCFSLYTAGIIIGWIAAAQSLISIVSSAVMLNNIDVIVNHTIAENVTSHNETKYIVESMLSGNIVFNVIDIFAAIMLLVGTLKGKRLFLMPWLINNFVHLTLCILLLAFAICVAFSTAVGLGFAVLIICSLIVGFYWHIWAAMYSLYKVIGMDETQRISLLGHGVPNYSTYVRVA